MKFEDYSPPSSPTIDQQRDALRKGLGRALQWAGCGKLDEISLLDACLHDLRFDGSVDDCRGAWLWKTLTARNCRQRMREAILDALQRLPIENDAEQLCELGFHFALLGDEPFRKRLYEIVEQKMFADCPWLAEEQVIGLDGINGLLFVARVRGAQLAGRDWEWDDRLAIDKAIERLGEERVVKALKSVKDESISRYREALLADREKSEPTRQSHRERMQAITIEQIISDAEAAGGRTGIYRGWGMHANAEHLETVFARLLNAREPEIVARYLSVFSNRSMPRIEPSYLSFCQHPDETVRNRALIALAQNTHPLIREFAWTQLQRSVQSGGLISLLIKNFQENDEWRLLEILQPPDDPDGLHWLLMKVIRVLEANPIADCSRLGVIAYALNPCASCRFSAARHLHRKNSAAEWLMSECRYDSQEDCRALFRRPPTEADPDLN